MGGRGASSGGRRGRAPVGYRTTGFSSGIRIVRNIKPAKVCQENHSVQMRNILVLTALERLYSCVCLTKKCKNGY